MGRTSRGSGSRLPAKILEPLSEAKGLYVEGKYAEAIEKFSAGIVL